MFRVPYSLFSPITSRRISPPTTFSDRNDLTDLELDDPTSAASAITLSCSEAIVPDLTVESAPTKVICRFPSDLIESSVDPDSDRPLPRLDRTTRRSTSSSASSVRSQGSIVRSPVVKQAPADLDDNKVNDEDDDEDVPPSPASIPNEFEYTMVRVYNAPAVTSSAASRTAQPPTNFKSGFTPAPGGGYNGGVGMNRVRCFLWPSRLYAM